MNHEVTVLIRTFNSRETILRAVDSVFHQTLNPRKIGILIVDDDSTDDTLELVENNPRIRILRIGHVGSLAALNIGLREVDTPYVIILDSDDWFEPSILEIMLDFAMTGSKVDFVRGS